MLPASVRMSSESSLSGYSHTVVRVNVQKSGNLDLKQIGDSLPVICQIHSRAFPHTQTLQSDAADAHAGFLMDTGVAVNPTQFPNSANSSSFVVV